MVVVNHHLFFADVMLRTKAWRAAPACNAVIFDGRTSCRKRRACSSATACRRRRSPTCPRHEGRRWPPRATASICHRPAPASENRQDLRLTLSVDPRATLAQLEARPGFDNLLAGLISYLGTFCGRRRDAGGAFGKGWRVAGSAASNCSPAFAAGAPAMNRRRRAATRAPTWRRALGRGDDLFAAVERTPLAIGEIFRKQMSGHPRAWIFTSATLAVQKDFGHYCAEMGLVDAESACWDSPSTTATRPCSTRRRPARTEQPGLHRAVANAAFRWSRPAAVAPSSCTSLRAMRRMHELLQDRLEAAGLDYPAAAG